MQFSPTALPDSQLMYACDGLQVRLCPRTHTPDQFDLMLLTAEAWPNHFELELLTPDASYKYGDYPAVEAHELAQSLIESRRAWSSVGGDCWRPVIWQTREWCEDRVEFWRRGPGGSELAVHQPHGTNWRMYWGILPVVRSHKDLGVFDTPWEAMGVLDNLAENGMRDVLLD
jgi:hypothetical protein